MVKFKLKGTIVTALTINESTGDTDERTFFVSKRYKAKTDRSIAAMLNQITRECAAELNDGHKVIYIKSFEPCDKFYGMETADFLTHAVEIDDNGGDES